MTITKTTGRTSTMMMMTREAKVVRTKRTARVTTSGERKSTSVMTMMARTAREDTGVRMKTSGETNTTKIRMIPREAREAQVAVVQATLKTIGETSTMRR